MHDKNYFKNVTDKTNSDDQNISDDNCEIEVLILVTHGIFVQSLPTLFEGRNGYANYCACSCIEFTWNHHCSVDNTTEDTQSDSNCNSNVSEPPSSRLVFDTTNIEE